MLPQKRKEFGDFQTPPEFAERVCALLRRKGISPQSVIEPTCGLGSFLFSALKTFPGAEVFRGYEINPDHIRQVRSRAVSSDKLSVIEADFFKTNWEEELKPLPSPVLVLGNPPWVTNAELMSCVSTNLPAKWNFNNERGIDALMGKSNFDICEWMMIRLLKALQAAGGTLAMLCKTSVARKAFVYAWKHRIPVKSASIYKIDAMEIFQAATDACLVIFETGGGGICRECAVFEDVDSTASKPIAIASDGSLVADANAYKKRRNLMGASAFEWRSGVKHDCAKIMDLSKAGGGYVNGFGSVVDIEDCHVYPALKSSDIASGQIEPRRFMIVTQEKVGQNTFEIKTRAPKTWQYLMDNKALLDRRGSVIYKTQPPFAVFGIGEYTFAPWKVAISGFYKKLSFVTVGSMGGKPIVLDDTCYFLPCATRAQAQSLCAMLNSDVAREFFNAFAFWDSKRPITKDLLMRLDMDALAAELGVPPIEHLLLKPEDTLFPC
jgi:hypothetical protein